MLCCRFSHTKCNRGFLDMRHGFSNNLKKGFTLTELLISMTLLSFVSAAVIMLISVMSNFSLKNSKELARIQQETEIREKIDLWFSVIDSEGFEIKLNCGEYLACATSNENKVFYIRLVDSEENETLQILIPSRLTDDGAVLMEIPSLSVQKIYFARKNDEGNGSFPKSDNEFVFPFKTHVMPANYLCKIIYST